VDDPLGPEDRRLFDEVTGVVAEELFARLAVRDRFETAEDAEAIAGLITDALWDRFEIRERERR
jgi:hypothetical protein